MSRHSRGLSVVATTLSARQAPRANKQLSVKVYRNIYRPFRNCGLGDLIGTVVGSPDGSCFPPPPNGPAALISLLANYITDKVGNFCAVVGLWQSPLLAKTVPPAVFLNITEQKKDADGGQIHTSYLTRVEIPYRL